MASLMQLFPDSLESLSEPAQSSVHHVHLEGALCLKKGCLCQTVKSGPPVSNSPRLEHIDTLGPPEAPLDLSLATLSRTQQSQTVLAADIQSEPLDMRFSTLAHARNTNDACSVGRSKGCEIVGMSSGNRHNAEVTDDDEKVTRNHLFSINNPYDVSRERLSENEDADSFQYTYVMVSGEDNLDGNSDDSADMINEASVEKMVENDQVKQTRQYVNGGHFPGQQSPKHVLSMRTPFQQTMFHLNSLQKVVDNSSAKYQQTIQNASKKETVSQTIGPEGATYAALAHKAVTGDLSRDRSITVEKFARNLTVMPTPSTLKQMERLKNILLTSSNIEKAESGTSAVLIKTQKAKKTFVHKSKKFPMLKKALTCIKGTCARCLKPEHGKDCAVSIKKKEIIMVGNPSKRRKRKKITSLDHNDIAVKNEMVISQKVPRKIQKYPCMHCDKIIPKNHLLRHEMKHNIGKKSKCRSWQNQLLDKFVTDIDKNCAKCSKPDKDVEKFSVNLEKQDTSMVKNPTKQSRKQKATSSDCYDKSIKIEKVTRQTVNSKKQKYPCTHCGKLLPKNHLLRHEMKHITDQKLKYGCCHYCGTFYNKPYLYRHERIHKKKREAGLDHNVWVRGQMLNDPKVKRSSRFKDHWVKGPDKVEDSLKGGINIMVSEQAQDITSFKEQDSDDQKVIERSKVRDQSIHNSDAKDSSKIRNQCTKVPKMIIPCAKDRSSFSGGQEVKDSSMIIGQGSEIQEKFENKSNLLSTITAKQNHQAALTSIKKRKRQIKGQGKQLQVSHVPASKPSKVTGLIKRSRIHHGLLNIVTRSVTQHDCKRSRANLRQKKLLKYSVKALSKKTQVTTAATLTKYLNACEASSFNATPAEFPEKRTNDYMTSEADLEGKSEKFDDDIVNGAQDTEAVGNDFLDDSQREGHVYGKYYCSECSYTSKWYHLFKVHTKVHKTMMNTYTCQACNIVFRTYRCFQQWHRIHKICHDNGGVSTKLHTQSAINPQTKAIPRHVKRSGTSHLAKKSKTCLTQTDKSNVKLADDSAGTLTDDICPSTSEQNDVCPNIFEQKDAYPNISEQTAAEPNRLFAVVENILSRFSSQPEDEVEMTHVQEEISSQQSRECCDGISEDPPNCKGTTKIDGDCHNDEETGMLNADKEFRESQQIETSKEKENSQHTLAVVENTENKSAGFGNDDLQLKGDHLDESVCLSSEITSKTRAVYCKKQRQKRKWRKSKANYHLMGIRGLYPVSKRLRSIAGEIVLVLSDDGVIEFYKAIDSLGKYKKTVIGGNKVGFSPENSVVTKKGNTGEGPAPESEPTGTSRTDILLAIDGGTITASTTSAGEKEFTFVRKEESDIAVITSNKSQTEDSVLMESYTGKNVVKMLGKSTAVEGALKESRLGENEHDLLKKSILRGNVDNVLENSNDKRNSNDKSVSHGGKQVTMEETVDILSKMSEESKYKTIHESLNSDCTEIPVYSADQEDCVAKRRNSGVDIDGCNADKVEESTDLCASKGSENGGESTDLCASKGNENVGESTDLCASKDNNTENGGESTDLCASKGNENVGESTDLCASKGNNTENGGESTDVCASKGNNTEKEVESTELCAYKGSINEKVGRSLNSSEQEKNSKDKEVLIMNLCTKECNIAYKVGKCSSHENKEKRSLFSIMYILGKDQGSGNGSERGPTSGGNSKQDSSNRKDDHSSKKDENNNLDRGACSGGRQGGNNNSRDGDNRNNNNRDDNEGDDDNDENKDVEFLICLVCKTSFSKKASLMKHLTKVHSLTNLCQFCYFSEQHIQRFANPVSLRNHKLRSHADLMVKCVCGTLLIDDKMLRFHQNKFKCHLKPATGEPKVAMVRCVCGKRFNSQQLLMEHQSRCRKRKSIMQPLESTSTFDCQTEKNTQQSIKTHNQRPANLNKKSNRNVTHWIKKNSVQTELFKASSEKTLAELPGELSCIDENNNSSGKSEQNDEIVENKAACMLAECSKKLLNWEACSSKKQKTAGGQTKCRMCGQMVKTRLVFQHQKLVHQRKRQTFSPAPLVMAQGSAGRKLYRCRWCRYTAVHWKVIVKHHYSNHDKKEVSVVSMEMLPGLVQTLRLSFRKGTRFGKCTNVGM